MLYSLEIHAAPSFDWSVIFGWFAQLWSLVQDTVIRGYGISVRLSDIIIGAIVTIMAVSIFWKGARA